MLSEVYETIAKMMVKETAHTSVGHFTYDESSAKMGAPIAGMMFFFIDKS